MIVAITGGSGFIGKLLVQKHLKLGNQVRLLSRSALLEGANIKCFFGDLSNPSVDLSGFVDGADILYHCAGEVNNESLMKELHVSGTQRLVDASQGKIGRWVQLSSVGAYGTCRDGTITENSKEQTVGIYESTKTESDDIVKKCGIPYAILRPSNVFGMTMRNQSLFQLIGGIRKGLFFYLGNQSALINYVHVEDVVRALVSCGTNDRALAKVYILSQAIEIEKMVHAFSLGLGYQRKFLNFPELPVRILVKLFEKLPVGAALTTSRIDALTGHCKYDSKKIINELNFEFGSTLQESFQLMASIK